MTTAERLARIEQKLNDLTDLLKDHKEEQRREHEEVARRVTEVERKINYAAGAIAALSLFFGVMVNYVKERLFG